MQDVIMRVSKETRQLLEAGVIDNLFYDAIVQIAQELQLEQTQEKQQTLFEVYEQVVVLREISVNHITV